MPSEKAAAAQQSRVEASHLPLRAACTPHTGPHILPRLSAQTLSSQEPCTYISGRQHPVCSAAVEAHSGTRSCSCLLESSPAGGLSRVPERTTACPWPSSSPQTISAHKRGRHSDQERDEGALSRESPKNPPEKNTPSSTSTTPLYHSLTHSLTHLGFGQNDLPLQILRDHLPSGKENRVGKGVTGL